MLNFEYLKPGATVILPELSGYMKGGTSEFHVVSVHPGGMGVCIHLRTKSPEYDYALKCIRPDLLGGKDSLSRFYDELDVWLAASACDAVAEAIAVIRINDVPSVLARWMPGGDLANSLPNLSSEKKFQVILRIVRGLNWVHDHLGVIHRDLKPANILLGKDNSAYLTDWGLSRPVNKIINYVTTESRTEKIDRPDRTQAGSFLGTILYAAPEQLLNAKDVDHRADIYALGCIMFEMETGSPPFIGDTAQEVAHAHLNQQPPKVARLFKNTALGIEKIIAKCLLKDRETRYQNYHDLEEGLLKVACERKYSTTLCEISERYERHQLGKGYAAQIEAIEKAPAKSHEFAVLEFEDIKPFLEEASNLIALNRFKEAEVLLKHHYVPEMLNNCSTWHLGHSLAANYAYCLQHLSGKSGESFQIYAKLSCLHDKPAEFYVNYSLALLKSHEWNQALTICKRGLTHYPNDLDILGNHTIALQFSGDLDGAQKSALYRLSLRRDVHTIEVAVSVIGSRKNGFRDTDLPAAIELAKTEYSLIREGLAINPRFPSLRITEIQFIRFAEAGDKALLACQAIMDDEQFGNHYRQLAFAEMIKELAAGDQFKVALELIKKHLNTITYQVARESIEFTKQNIYADRFMIGNHNEQGDRIIVKEAMDFFCATKNSRYPYPVTSARVLDWIGRTEEAEGLFRSEAEHSWEAIKHFSIHLQRVGKKDEAYKWAEYLIQTAPWRAESYDVLAYIAGCENDSDVQVRAKRQGNQVFQKEMALYDELRTILV